MCNLYSVVSCYFKCVTFCLESFIFEMAEKRDNFSAPDEPSDSVVPSVQRADFSEQVSAVKLSLCNIQGNFQRLVAMQTCAVTADNLGINSNFSDVSGPSSGSGVPPFIALSSEIFSSTSQWQGISPNSAINALDVTLPVSISKGLAKFIFSIGFDPVICTRPLY